MGRAKFDSPTERVIVALDFDDFDQAKKVLDELDGTGVMVKIGLQLGTYAGWGKLIDYVHQRGLKVFCDTKFKDIGNTVKGASRSISRFSPEMFNVMADTPASHVRAAVEGVDSAVADFQVKKPLILGVTVLTSYSDDDSQTIYGKNARDGVQFFAEQALENGLDGIVCSPQEVEMLRANDKTKNAIYVTPGIRPEWAVAGDQARPMTPLRALEAGVDYLVIGRPITKPPEKVGSSKKAVELILDEIKDHKGESNGKTN